MNYLFQQKIIHGDLALRNLLVDRNPNVTQVRFIVKVGDFGMSKSLATKGYNKLNANETIVPIKWCAPEVLFFEKLSLYSDCWSYGILLWELFSYGMKPYAGLSNLQAVEKIQAGYRLNCPKNCPSKIYQLMLDLWKEEPTERISYRECFEILDTEWNLQLKSNSAT